MSALSLTDITNSIKNAKVCFHDVALKNGIPEMCNGRPICFSGNYGAVFKFDCNSIPKAVRVWTKDLSLMPELPQRAEVLSSKIRQIQKDFFVDFKYIEKGLLVSGQWTPIVVMDWCKGQNLKDFIQKNIRNPEALETFAKNFLEMIRFFHENHISHGDLQHGNILVNEDCSIRLIDYDSLYIECPGFSGKIEEIKGLPAYQHPNRMNNLYANDKVDYFSELIIYLSIVALIEDPNIWTFDNIMNKDYSLLFEQQDFVNFRDSKIYHKLSGLSNNTRILLDVLDVYLKTNDITKLQPFDYVALQQGAHLLENKILAKYCINCGAEFISIEDFYCYNCGTKRNNGD